MIRLVNDLPEVSKPTAEYIRIKCLFDCYSEYPGNMTVSYGGGDTGELAGCIKMLNPRTLFTDSATFEKLGIQPDETAEVMGLYIDTSPLSDIGDRLSSKDIYEVFSAAGLDVPQVLAENDAYHALQKIGGLLMTGPTGTNVNDLAMILIWR